MFKCKRTGNAVILSTNSKYPFQDPENDEDLFFFEVEPKVSQKAMNEASEMLNLKNIPDNFSTDKQLVKFAQESLQTRRVNLENFKELEVFKSQDYEYCQGVLIAIIWFLA